MKTFATLALMLVVILSTLTVSFAADKQPDYLSLGRQEEKLGNYNAAANYYINAVSVAEGKANKAELHANEVVRMFVVSSTARETLATMLTLRDYDQKRANSLLAKYEQQTRKQVVDYASQNREFGFPHEGQRNEAIAVFLQFFPQAREALAEDFNKLGTAEGNTYWYNLATQTSDKIGGKIAKQLLGDISKLTLQQKAQRLIMAGKYITDQKQRQAFVNELLPEGKRLAVIPDRDGTKTYENRTKEIRQALVVLNGQEWVDDIKHLPETVVLPYGETMVEVQAGQQIPYMIAFPSDRPTNTKIFSNKNAEFVKVYDDGTIVGMSQTHKGNLSKIRVIATKYSKLWFEVK